MNPFSNKSLLYISVLFLLVGLSACKSKKKIQQSSDEIVVETIIIEKDIIYNDVEREIIDEALTWLGTPYSYGASEKGISTDCSGMVMVIYRDIADIKMPRNSAKQAEFCKKIKEKDVRGADLVFFATGSDENQISHVGIMLDDVKFIHASASKGVIISEMTTPYYKRHFKMYGRVRQNSDK